MPDDLQRDIRRHLFKFLNKVRIFTLMDESILNAIRERLKHITYISSSVVFSAGDVIEKIVFIVRGEMESIGKDGSVISLSEGDVFGEELLSWCLERAASNTDGTRIWIKRKGLLSYRSVRCVTNVDVFSLSVADLDDVTRLFSRFLGSCKVQGAIRYESPYWRLRAAMEIQVAWRYRRRRLKRLYCSV
ncbi:probable cyclic nucleotide-gated ion channel 20, chloroplastic isoform X1 [Brassica napus]|uniref:probable cyclic nucleotide-gated ion channel 20, chloroplastic isoform X1 n=1 Tax=Brassica napus TaxID=3708 RepID=UPI00207898DD|nr:probable cyclic nucleotide-gated ion channel 20, chloroplastic isoform X1 [Brassica napus]